MCVKHINCVITSTTQFFGCTPGEQQMSQVCFMSLISILFTFVHLVSAIQFLFFRASCLFLYFYRGQYNKVLLSGELQHKFSNKQPKEVIDLRLTRATPSSLQIMFCKIESGLLGCLIQSNILVPFCYIRELWASISNSWERFIVSAVVCTVEWQPATVKREIMSDLLLILKS